MVKFCDCQVLQLSGYTIVRFYNCQSITRRAYWFLCFKCYVGLSGLTIVKFLKLSFFNIVMIYIYHVCQVL